MHMKKGVFGGYTLVELTVTIIVIGILVSIVALGVTKHQADARDEQRSTQSNSLAEALEKYYVKNGEYPSVRRMVNTFSDNSAESVASTLGITTDTLKMPGSSSPQSITPVSIIEKGTLSYSAESAINNDSCQNVINGGCDSYTLSYLDESGDTVVIVSRYDGSQRTNVAAAPAQPVLSAGSGAVSNTVEVTSTEPNCAENANRLTSMYTFRYRINSAAWSAWVNWTTSPSFVVGASQGQTVDFIGQTRCDDGATAGIASPQSNVESYSVPVGAPAAPTITVANSGNSVTGSVSTTTCPAGTTTQYGIRSRVNNGTWSPYSTWSTTRTSSQGSNEGFKYDYQAQARCTGSSTSAAVTSAVGTYTRPITSAPTVTVSVATSGATSTWSWSTPTCPAGTTPYYQYQSEADWNYVSAWYGPYANYTSNTWDTSRQGYEYTRRVQARCANTYTTGAWGAAATASYLRPIATPSAPTNFVVSISSDKKYVYTDFSTSTCGPGTTYEFQYMANWNGSTTFPGTWAQTGLIGYATRATQVVTDSNGNYVPFSSGSKTRVEARYRCVNQTTGRVSAWGPVAIGPVFTVP